MSKISIAALGGLGENGKNMFIVEVDERIFILDAGLKYPEIDLYGVDAVIPDISYLIENRNRIEGIFISHGHEDHIGALPYILENINIRVYGTHFTICLIEDLLAENNMTIDKFKLYRINENKTLKFGEITVSFYNTTHSIPESVGIAISTEDGTIIYSPDFNFNPTVGSKYKTSYDKITELGKRNVLAVMAESLGVSDLERTSSDRLFEHTFNNVLTNAEGRIIISAFSSDLNRIQKIIDMSIQAGRRIAIIGRKAQRIIDIAMKSEYLKIPTDYLVNLKFKDNSIELNEKEEEEIRAEKKLVIIASGVRHEPYLSLIRMVNKQDRLVQLTQDDSVILISNPVPGTEKIAAEVLDALYRNDINVIQFEKKILRSSHANSEDLKLFYAMLKPKYFIPIIGEYRHLYEHQKVIKSAGYAPESIIILENGQVVTFENGQKGSLFEIHHGDILVDGSLTGSIDQSIIDEREKLADEGAIIVVANIDVKAKKLVSGPMITTRGFVSKIPLDQWKEQILELSMRIINTNLHKTNFKLEELEKTLSNDISNIAYRQTKKRPIIIPVLIDTKNK